MGWGKGWLGAPPRPAEVPGVLDAADTRFAASVPRDRNVTRVPPALDSPQMMALRTVLVLLHRQLHLGA
jgi:hypothetical protein